jgi:hypothetical protein
MIVTVLIAHVAYGLMLWLLLRRWLPEGTWLARAASGACTLDPFDVACESRRGGILVRMK